MPDAVPAQPPTAPSAPADDAPASGAPSEIDAELALARLASWASAVRGGCVLEGSGEVLAATGERDRWTEVARDLLAAADTAAGEPVTQAHVGTDDGEVFAVRERGYALVAATDRFPLASLMLFDLRSALRMLVRAERPAASAGQPAAGR